MNLLKILPENGKLFGLKYKDLNTPGKSEFFINPADYNDGFSLVDFENAWNILFTDPGLYNFNGLFKQLKAPMVYYVKGILNNSKAYFI